MGLYNRRDIQRSPTTTGILAEFKMVSAQPHRHSRITISPIPESTIFEDISGLTIIGATKIFNAFRKKS